MNRLAGAVSFFVAQARSIKAPASRLLGIQTLICCDDGAPSMIINCRSMLVDGKARSSSMRRWSWMHRRICMQGCGKGGGLRRAIRWLPLRWDFEQDSAVVELQFPAATG